jgi:hypothetical protein
MVRVLSYREAIDLYRSLVSAVSLLLYLLPLFSFLSPLSPLLSLEASTLLVSLVEGDDQKVP